MPARKNIFVSYSHKDKKLFEEFQTMMAPAIQRDIVDLWDDQRIAAGAKWQEEIQKALASARVAVLLVSQNFLASQFIAEKELPPLLKAAADDGVTIFWICLSSCLFDQTEIASYQAAYDPSRPLDRLSKSQRQAVLSSVCEKLIKVARGPAVPASPGPAASPAIDPRLIGTWNGVPGNPIDYSFRADGTYRRIEHRGIPYRLAGRFTTEGNYTLNGNLLTLHDSQESWEPTEKDQTLRYFDRPSDVTRHRSIGRLDEQTLILESDELGELGFDTEEFERARS
ncbi:MAG: toll/interleukin-1 receptor domain-containing protein [Candidatus Korobacteraceae bacterium]